jgi:hypothetical protein
MGATSDSNIYFNAFLLTPWRAMHDTVLNGINSFVQRECMDAIWNFTKDTLWSSVDNSVSGHSTVDNFIKSYYDT